MALNVSEEVLEMMWMEISLCRLLMEQEKNVICCLLLPECAPLGKTEISKLPKCPLCCVLGSVLMENILADLHS